MRVAQAIGMHLEPHGEELPVGAGVVCTEGSRLGRGCKVRWTVRERYLVSDIQTQSRVLISISSLHSSAMIFSVTA